MTWQFPDWMYRARLRFDSRTGLGNLAAKRLAKRIDWAGWQPGRPTILCLNRALFAKDLAEMRKRCDLNLPTIHVKKVKRLQQAWIPPRWQVQTYFTNWLDNEVAWAERDLVAVIKTFIAQASATHRIDGIMAANMDYWQDEAIKRACASLKIPFIVLCRENYGIPYWQAALHKRVADAKFEFRGAGIAVASNKCTKCILESGAVGQAKIEATGYPRYDIWTNSHEVETLPRNAITLMSYADPNYHAPENFREVLALFLRHSQEYHSNPPLDFVIKLKKPADIERLLDMEPALRTSSITITADEPLHQLVKRSKAVIGFNTLAMFEALLGDTAVIVPFWGDAQRDPSWALVHPSHPLDREIIYFPASSAELSELMDRSTRQALLPNGTEEARFRRFSQQSIVHADVSASERVEAFVRLCLQNPLRRHS